MRKKRGCFSRLTPLAALAAMLAVSTPQSAPLQTGTLISISPLGVSPLIQVTITGTGFNTTASQNEVTFTPAAGAAQSVTATTIATVDATRDWRRITAVVPSGLPAGKADVKVTNKSSGLVSSGLSIDILYLSPPQPSSGVVGTTGLRVVLTGASGTNFIAGQSIVSLGAGITVRSVQVLAPTQVAATVDIAANATTGARHVIARSTNQSLLLANGFTVTAAPPPNRQPTANANGPYSGTTGQAVSFTSTGSTDPDADPLTFAWAFGDGGTSTDENPTHTYQAAGPFEVSLTVNDGKGGTSTSTTSATIVQANRPPRITSTPGLSATVGQAYAYQVVATDPDTDALTYALTQSPAGMTIAPASGVVAWTPLASQSGPQAVTIVASDGRGGSDAQHYSIQTDAPAAVLTSIDATPSSVRFSQFDATRALVVTGTKSDGTSPDLTAAAAGTTYASSNAFVASVGVDGVVTARGNGDTSITVTNGVLTDTVAVTVEVGVTLQSLSLTPALTTLRLAGAAQPLTLRGTFSDGSIRDLTSAPGTSYLSNLPAIATVSAAGLVAAVASGQAEISASLGEMSATAQVLVSIPAGSGFIRGAAFDDSRGLPLTGATVHLISDGGGALSAPVTTTTDDLGRYALPARGGEALVRIQKDGFTTVDRLIDVPAAGVARALDGRLTPIDSRHNPLQSVFGGQARDASGAAALTFASGALPGDADVRLTPISPQGLGGRLPYGWSPIAAVDVLPAGIALSQPATLVLPNTGGAAAAATVTIAAYDRSVGQWMVIPTGQVSQDGRSITMPIQASGQFVALVADAAPQAPPDAVPGRPLTGVDAVTVPADITADGDVLPRSAAPGAGARAVGRIAAGASTPLPSGTVLQVHVSERFDLIDSTTAVPLPFTQDIVLHARPRPPTGGSLGAAFPITPSRNYSIQELMRGVVTLDVRRAVDDIAGTPVGSQGAVVADVEGDLLVIPPAALATDTIIRLARLVPPLSIDIPAGFELIAALDVDLVGRSFSLPAQLSVTVPGGLVPGDQVLLVQSFVDPLGVRRMRVAGIGRIDAGRLVSDHVFGGLTFRGVTAGGQYFFLKAIEPEGFVTGVVSTADGIAPAPLALVTSSTSPFVDITAATGRYIVVARAGFDAGIAARHLFSADGATGTARPSTRDAVVDLPLTLAIAPPSVSAVSPAAGAVNVPLETSITVDFSEPIDPASITPAAVMLQSGGVTVAATRTLSQDGRRLTVRPDASLAGKSTYTVTITSAVKDLSGAALVPFAPVSFATLDPTKPPQPPPGQIVAELPDDDGLILVTGAPGTSEPGLPVTATNTRTQETTTVLATTDGSFRLRVSGVVGDEVTLTLRDASGRETTIAITQLEGPNNKAAIGVRGGTINGPGGRLGTILPKSLVQAGVFSLAETSAAAPLTLGATLSFVDRFTLQADGAAFNTLTSLTLTESQGRIAATPVMGSPFEALAQLTVPGNFLVNSAIRFSALAQDAAGTRRSVSATTVVVAGTADVSLIETSQGADFPTVFVNAPHEATQNQVIGVAAVAPAARIDLSVPAPPGAAAAEYLLTRVVDVAGEARLAIVDRLYGTAGATGPVLRTSGRTLPGMTRPGDYAVVASTEPLAFVTGQMVGAPGSVTVDDSPFVFEATGPNSRFIVPVAAGRPYTLRFVNADGTVRGTAGGQAPASGATDVGDPLGIVAGRLLVTAEPGAGSVADINSPLVLRFSEPADISSLTAALVVTDIAGARVFGKLWTVDGGRTVEFRPTRRWRFSTTYRIGVSTGALAISGARLSAPFSSQFTTFAPSLIGQAAMSRAVDVATAGALAIVATESGASVMDVTSSVRPVSVAHIPFPGGVRAAAILSSAALTSRTGQVMSGTFAVLATGDATSAAQLQLYDLSSPGAPALLGSTQLTTAPGDIAPAGVPDAGGTPRQIVITADNRALVAIEDVGVIAVNIGQMTPDAPSIPGQGIVARYPTLGAESISSLALVGDRLVVAGPGGLAVLDSVTLERRGGLLTDGGLRKVDGLSAFAMDLDGDGAITPGELIDIAIATGDSDGTLQIFRLPAIGDPSVLSVVRFTDSIISATVSANERLAYIGVDGIGLSMVDLDGPASVQPLDVDRNGVDDRVLGSVVTPGAVARTALALARGRGLIADGASGLAIVRLLPPRVLFHDVLRDPVRVITGDEQSIFGSRRAFTTDDGLQLTIELDSDIGETATLVLDEAPPAGGVRVLSFAAGQLAVPLSIGSNSIDVRISGANAPGTRARFAVQDRSGRIVATFDIAVDLPDPGAAHLDSLLLGPDPALVAAADPDRLLLGVAGIYDDGQILNLTTAASGTSYRTGSQSVALIDVDGRVTARGGGTTVVTATNSGVQGRARLTVERPRALVGLTSPSPRISFRAAAATQMLEVHATFSDATIAAAAATPGTTFASSDASIVAVTVGGLATAVGEGEATITVQNGAFRLEIAVINEWRMPSAITSIHLVMPDEPVSVDDGRVRLGAVVRGTGSLDGLEVRFVINGAVTAQLTGVTALDGSASVMVEGLTAAGNLNLTALAVDPASGEPRSVSGTVAVGPRHGDAEPNDSVGAAANVEAGEGITGSVNVSGDVADTFRLPDAYENNATALLTLPDGVDPSQVQIVVRDASGSEIARITPASSGTELSVALPAGSVFVSIQAVSGAIDYELSFDIDQAPVTISSASPLSGARGTLVTINGTGFGADPSQVRVLFAGIPGRVTSVSPTRIQVLVPGNANTGPLRVVASQRQAQGPTFSAGAVSLTPVMTPALPGSLTREPGTGALTLIDRLTIRTDPVATRAEVEALAASVSASVVSVIPGMHLYVLEFAGNRSFNALQAKLLQLGADPLVTSVSTATFDYPDTTIQIDLQNLGDEGDINPHEMIDLFKALEAIRATPPFDDRARLREVRVAIIDDGFNPGTATAEFENASGSAVRQFANGFALTTNTAVQGEHGTPVTSVIAAVNNDSPVSGVLNGVVANGERPFKVDMYRLNLVGSGFDPTVAAASISYLSNLAEPPHVVNMSFGSPVTMMTATNAAAYKRLYQDALALAPEKMLFVISAGNDGIDAKDHYPCAFARTMSNVICVGAVATATNGDGTGEDPDERADFGVDKTAPFNTTLCAPGRHRQSSNCGTSVTIAAPGEDLRAIDAGGERGVFGATSGATPMVTGVAALIHAIWRDGELRPSRLRALLVGTADNISRKWNPGNMRRINALSAVRAVLPETRPQKVYIADDGDDQKGFIVGIEIDPLTGQRPTSPEHDLHIPLSVSTRGTTIELLRPTTITTGTATNRIYVAAETDDDQYGDGVVVVNSHDYTTLSFIPLSGIPFPVGNAASRPPVRFGSRTPALRLSKDERLLYVVTATRLIVINTVTNKVVQRFVQLPAQYRTRAATLAAGELQTRLDTISTRARDFAVNGATGARSFADATLSPDGRTLYLAVRTGSGTGAQPGFVLPVNVDLYHDALTTKLLLQSDLANYLKPGTPLAMTGTPLMEADEPSAVTTSPDGRHIYLVNGGVEKFEGKPPADKSAADYLSFVLGSIFGSASAGSGMAGLQSSEAQFQLAHPQVLQQMQLDFKLTAESGRTLLFAPSMTGVFGTERPTTAAGEVGTQQWVFPSQVTFGWNPPLGAHGNVVDQFNYRELYAKRPFGMAIRPDGGRALVPYFQTGNFGVLDLGKQSLFSNPNAGGVAATLFQGVVGVTEAIRLDNHLWPQRGAYSYFENNAQLSVPSPDEDLLYPGPIEYAQNGRFAAAVHTGTRRPRTVTAPLPDFVTDNDARLSLNSIGFSIAPGAGSGTDPDGNAVASRQPYEFFRGGGTVSLLHDGLITTDLNANAGQPVVTDTDTRTYYSINPVCAELLSRQARCKTPVFDQWSTYDNDGVIRRFSRPRGVSIQPFVAFETPRFGDHVFSGTQVRFRWRDSRVAKFRLEVFDLGTVQSPVDPLAATESVERAITARELVRQTVGHTFAALFGSGDPVRGHVYRLRVKVIAEDGQTLSTTSTEVFFAR